MREALPWVFVGLSLAVNVALLVMWWRSRKVETISEQASKLANGQVAKAKTDALERLGVKLAEEKRLLEEARQTLEAGVNDDTDLAGYLRGRGAGRTGGPDS